MIWHVWSFCWNVPRSECECRCVTFMIQNDSPKQKNEHLTNGACIDWNQECIVKDKNQWHRCRCIILGQYGVPKFHHQIHQCPFSPGYSSPVNWTNQEPNEALVRHWRQHKATCFSQNSPWLEFSNIKSQVLVADGGKAGLQWRYSSQSYLEVSQTRKFIMEIPSINRWFWGTPMTQETIFFSAIRCGPATSRCGGKIMLPCRCLSFSRRNSSGVCRRAIQPLVRHVSCLGSRIRGPSNCGRKRRVSSLKAGHRWIFGMNIQHEYTYYTICVLLSLLHHYSKSLSF